MAAHTHLPQSSSARLVLLKSFVPPRRLLAFSVFAWLFAGALILGLTVTGARASTSIDYSWETGDNSQFSALECAHPSSQFQVVTSPVREGKYAAEISETPTDIWSNGQVRCLDARYDTGETTGNDYYFGLSVYIPSSGLNDNLIWELHHPSTLYNISACGVAPFALTAHSGALVFRIFTGDCTPGVGSAYKNSNIPIAGLNPMPRNQWIDFVFHINFQESSTGSVQVWSRVAGNAWPSSPQISLGNIPTMPFCSSLNIHNVKLYTEMGLYPGYAPYTTNDTVYLDAYKRGTAFSDVAPGGTTSAPAPTTTTTATTTSGTTTTTAGTTTTSPTTTTSSTTTTTTTTTSTTTSSTPTTTTTVTTSTSSHGRGHGSGGSGGGRGSTAVGSVRLLTNVTGDAVPKAVKVLSITLQTNHVPGFRVSLVDSANHRIPLLKHSLIGAVGIQYWRKTLAVDSRGQSKMTLQLRVGRAHLRRAGTLRLRIETRSASGRKTVYLPIA